MEKGKQRKLHIHKAFLAAVIVCLLLWQELPLPAWGAGVVQAAVLGTKAAPIPIDSVQGLKDIKNDMNKHYILTADIELDPYQYWVPIGFQERAFTGSFNGNGHTIKNLTINAPLDHLGLFYCMNDATVQNLTLENVNIQGNNMIGAIAGSAGGVSQVDHCSVSGIVRGDSLVGGLFGSFTGTGRIEESSMSGEVSATFGETGGLLGYMADGGLEYVQMSGEVNSDGRNVGGLVGRMSGGYIEQSENIADVSATTMGDYVGGIVGRMNKVVTGSDVSIKDSSNTGNVTGLNYVGGIAGFFEGTEISTVSNTGNVTASEFLAGGIVGSISGYVEQNGLINKAANWGNVSGDRSVGGIAGGTSNFNEFTVNIMNSYNRGNITAATYDSGGIVGSINSLAGNGIQYCYSTGDIAADFGAGGLVGYGISGLIKNSLAMNENVSAANLDGHRILGRMSPEMSLNGNMAYDDMAVTVNGVVSSIKPGNPSYNSQDGQNCAKMLVMQNSAYLELMGWDFQNIWEIGADYPVLQNVENDGMQ